MAQDRSRSAFDVRKPKHWAGLQAQQGRLLSDDDWNEADAIRADDTRHAQAQIIGPAGSPDTGFQLANPRGTGALLDFDVLAGTMYVGGLRATLEQSEPFSTQRDWLQLSASDRPPLATAERIDLAYLEVWQQPVTAVEDAELQEVALGGPDTSVRIRTMRRVHLWPNVGSENCATAWASFVTSKGGLGVDNEWTSNASLTVGNAPSGGTATNLCSPSAQLGYLGAENQAIRVELGTGNTLLWGYNNASPLYRVQLTTDGSGTPIVHFLTPPKDELSWPLAQQVVEILPWSAVLPNNEKVAETSGGFLARVSASYDPNTQNIQLSPSVPATFGSAWQSRSDHAALGTSATAYVYLRVWNRGADTASPPQIPFTIGTPVELTGTGLQVTITGSTLRTGDFWIIAARPKSPDQVVPWSLKTGRVVEGVRRFYAPLGLIHWRSNGAHTVFDCRPTFAPLTQPQGCCVTIAPRSGWEHELDALADVQDLCLCFQPGDYTTSRTVVFRNKHVQVHGAGGATRISGLGIETVLRFEGCIDVEIKDLQVSANVTTREGQGAPRPHLGGAITTRNCNRVAISGVIAQCASATARDAACIAIYSELAAAQVQASTARVHGCELIVGANQVGLSIINYGHTTVTDNVVHVDPTTSATIPAAWFQDRAFRIAFRKTMVYRCQLPVAGKGIPTGWIAVSLSGTTVWLDTAAALKATWQAVINTRKFRSNKISHLSVSEFLNELAMDLTFAQGGIGPKRFPDFERFIAAQAAVKSATTGVRLLAAQGIVIAGTAAHDVRITGNLVRDTPQGIHVGVSTSTARNPGTTFDSAGRVEICRNSVYITLMPESVGERHAIFTGNCRSVLIEDNHLECEKLATATRLHIDGIRCYGAFGKFAYVTRNDMIGFDTGIRIAPLNDKAAGPSSMWKVVDNLTSGATAVVDQSLKIGSSIYVVSTGNRA